MTGRNSYNRYELSNYKTQSQNNNSLTLLLVGDVMFGGDFVKFKRENGIVYEYPFEKCRDVFRSMDIVFANLESTLSSGGVPRKTCVHLYSPPECIAALRYLNVDVVSLANNHINDYGERGLIKTIKILKNNKILTVGAGRNLEEARKEAVVERNGSKISFLAYTCNQEGINSIIAGEKTAGCAPYDLEKIKEDIERVKKHCNIICVSLHWGCEHYRYPSPQQIKLAHQIIDDGAHIVVGHHPHIIQGFERYNHGVIFYSLGNFFLPNLYYYNNPRYLYNWLEEHNKSLIARCLLDDGGVAEVQLLYAFMNKDYQVVVLEGEAQEDMMREVQRISKVIKREDYKHFWENYDMERSKELVEIAPDRLFAQLQNKELVEKQSLHRRFLSKLLLRFQSLTVTFYRWVKGRHDQA